MQITDNDNTSSGRLFVNKTLLPRLIEGMKDGDRVLFVGLDTNWNYKPFFFNPHILCDFVTAEMQSGMKPDIECDICDCKEQIPDNSFDLVLLIGMYECVNNPKGMIEETNRILKTGGRALIAFPGKGYREEGTLHPEEIFEASKPMIVEEVYLQGEFHSSDRDIPPASIIVVAKKTIDKA